MINGPLSINISFRPMTIVIRTRGSRDIEVISVDSVCDFPTACWPVAGSSYVRAHFDEDGRFRLMDHMNTTMGYPGYSSDGFFEIFPTSFAITANVKYYNDGNTLTHMFLSNDTENHIFDRLSNGDLPLTFLSRSALLFKFEDGKYNLMTNPNSR